MDELMAFYQHGLFCLAMSVDTAVAEPADGTAGEEGSGWDAFPQCLAAAACESGPAPASAAA